MNLNRLKKAERILESRKESYGDSDQMLEVISKYWSVLFEKSITKEDVVKAMILFKLARSAGSDDNNEDDILDIIGYASIYPSCADTEKILSTENFHSGDYLVIGGNGFFVAGDYVWSEKTGKNIPHFDFSEAYLDEHHCLDDSAKSIFHAPHGSVFVQNETENRLIVLRDEGKLHLFDHKGGKDIKTLELNFLNDSFYPDEPLSFSGVKNIDYSRSFSGEISSVTINGAAK